jgi:predicted dehydrogenase
MTNGARVVYTGSWVSRGWQTTWDGDWRIQGSEGEIHWADNEVHIHPGNVFTSVFVRGARETRGGRMIVDLAELAQEDRWASLTEFAAAIREGREPATSGADNLRTLAMVLGARRSIETGQPVAIADVLAEADAGGGST